MKGQKWGENFKQQEQQQRCLNPKAKLHQGQDQLRYHLGSAKGTAEKQQPPLKSMLRVTQAFIPWQGHWRRHLQFISDKYKAMGSGCQCCKRDLYLRE